MDTTKHKRTTQRWKMAGTILCLYIATLAAVGCMFIGKDFLPHYGAVSLAYAVLLAPMNVWIARKTQKVFFKRIHKLAYEGQELTLSPGELPAARKAVLIIPWAAAVRDTVLWIITNAIYCVVVLNAVDHIHHYRHAANFSWWYEFLLITFPVTPIVLVAALLAYSLATSSYNQFFFRAGEYEQYGLAMTPVRRRYAQIALIGFGLLLIIFAMNYRFSMQSSFSSGEAIQSLQQMELSGGYLLSFMCSVLWLLSRQEAKAAKRTTLPRVLAERQRTIQPMDKRCPKCQLTVGPGMDMCPQDGTPLTFPGDESASFGTNYEFIEEIARGGMSVIYKARHRLLGKVVAIKMLDTRISESQAVERFAHEARAASRLEHPNIVSVLDFGAFESHKLFLVMEYLSGVSLARMITKSNGGLPVRDCLQIFDQICDAMAYAHQSKILHRDLKPSNIMVSEQAGFVKFSVKVVDFGIAKVLEGTAGNITKTGDVFGTPAYMSPEQCLGQQLGPTSDIYSMGCLMYEALTGSAAADGENPLTMMYKQINEQPAPLHVKRPELANIPQLEAVVMKAMAKRPEQRYASFADLRSALQSVSASIRAASYLV